VIQLAEMWASMARLPIASILLSGLQRATRSMVIGAASNRWGLPPISTVACTEMR
jgi:hypothetical protein